MGQNRRRKRQAARFDAESEPSYSDLVDWGGELWLAEGFTAGGAPFGLTLTEMREMDAREFRQKGWARARRVLETAFAAHPCAWIGRVVKIGHGLSSEVYAAQIELTPDPASLSGAYAVSLRSRPADIEREARIVACVAAQTRAIRTPTVFAVDRNNGEIATVRRYLEGVELDLRAGGQRSVRPWEVVAQVAAAIHGVDVADLDVPGYATRREHALAAIAVLADRPELARAHAWALEHLPPDEPSVLLHGDLLGQNVVLCPGAPPGVIDWEAAKLGDPAYDLAIVTRGSKRPFGIDRGLDRLLSAYDRGAPRRVTAIQVGLHELCLVARWYRDAVESARHEEIPQALGGVANVFERCVSRAAGG